jgi:hypothetical protein
MDIIQGIQKIEQLSEKTSSSSSDGTFATVVYFVEFLIGVFLLTAAIFILPWALMSHGEGGFLLLPLQFFMIPLLPIISFALVFRDAKKLKMKGAKIENPGVWAAVSALSYPIGVSIYLALRRASFKKQAQENTQQSLPQNIMQ